VDTKKGKQDNKEKINKEKENKKKFWEGACRRPPA
jgi:hypothetical protein